MPVTVAVPAFLAGALVSLATSWVLVTRLERVGERLGLSEALLGIVAALAADAPEITAAVTAMAGHQQRLGAGVVIGSNVFNLAALLGLGAVVAGRIRLHRKVIVLGGAVAICVASVCLAVVLGLLAPVAGLMLALATGLQHPPDIPGRSGRGRAGQHGSGRVHSGPQALPPVLRYATYRSYAAGDDARSANEAQRSPAAAAPP